MHKWKTFKTVDNVRRSGRLSKFIPRADYTLLREKATSQSLQASISMLNLKIHESTVRKSLTKYDLLKRDSRRKFLLSKKTWQHSLDL